ncbi:hypothetical protein AQJ11_03175 [Streptomyces corchorusii]|uniref:Uncharacterized protein n=2 Tax=Streptomyces TaxID=1883 RepID=A0A101QMF6_STRCK|nr:hypothetical protein [Streptomyces corchorusii]KUN32543.1 hypothetical protein AQJ11_03175 [Streptomyces corchorusii]
MAVSGNFTNCNCGPDVPACANPTEPVATVGLCLTDGTPIAVTVVRDCAGAVTQEGWIDLTTGLYTAGPPPAGTAACDTGCVDTVCVQRCDDTNGDGAADQTYSELWCVRADGTATLVLTYQDDPSVPYSPASPVDCEYGCPATETLPLCDDSGPFLRRYTWLNGTAGFEDFELDGVTAHVVTGTVRTCAGAGSPDTPCEAQTTPAATLGLCLPDGTPIAVLVTRDCAGTVTQDGWLNLTTGAYSTGAPPAGAMACGDSRAFELAGLLCDVDPTTGDVLGLVLVEYEYNVDGSLASVRLVDPATGNTYTLQGELRHCPAGVAEQPERDLVLLCDTAADGTVTTFIRDYARDENGQITGHTDYLLDGTPYTAVGIVGVCSEPETADVESWPLCVVDAATGVTVARVRRETVYDGSGEALTTRLVDAMTGAPYTLPTGTRLGECCETTREAVCVTPLLPTSQRVVSNPGNNTSGRVDPAWTWGMTPAGGRTVYDVAGPAAWTTPRPPGGGWVSLTPSTATTPLPSGAPADYYMVTAFELPDDAVLDATTIKIDTLNADNAVLGYALNGAAETRTNAQATWFNRPPYTETEHRIAGAVRGTNLLAIRVTETTPPSSGGVLLDVTLTYRVPGAPEYWTVEHRDCGTTTYIDPDGNRYQGGLPDGYMACGGGSGGSAAPCGDTETLVLCDTAADGTVTQFLRRLTYDCTGEVATTVDTELDGTTPYTVAGTAGVCSSDAEPCRNTSTLLVCDLPTGGTPTPTVTDTDPNAYVGGPPTVPVPGGAAALWSGGSITIGPDPAPGPHPSGVVRTMAATVQAARPSCDTGTAHVKLSVDVAQLGPTAACGPTGWLMLFNGTTRITHQAPPNNAPIGWTGTLTVEADVPAADLAAGQIAAVLGFDTYDSCDGITAARTSWQLSAFTAETTYDQAGCPTQVLANVVTDCETGAVESVTYTTLDGAPYTPTGTIGQCETAGGGSCCPEQPCPAQNVLEVCRCDDTTGDGSPDKEYIELLAVDCEGNLVSIGTYSPDLSAPYTPVAPVPCEAGGDAEPALGVQAGRVQLAVGDSWSAATTARLQSVTVTAHTGPGQITTSDGTSTLFQGETVTWSTNKEGDALLTGPLTITAVSGIVTVTYTRGVTL